MSVQFGIFNFEDTRIDKEMLNHIRPMLAAQGPDSENVYEASSLGIVYRAFFTTPEARYESQPHTSRCGAVITWDGRLDNREDLMKDFGMTCPSSVLPDVDIVSEAYDRWGRGCLPRLIGDWAMSVFDPTDRSLLIAKDHIGTRQLYYVLRQRAIVWSTLLEPLVEVSSDSLSVDLTYIAGWLGVAPPSDHTPYIEIRAVPPAHYLLCRGGRTQIARYWDFDSRKQIRYKADADYEVHFREIFAGAVRRRLRSHTPVLAELSGGMDSGSIVCMADRILQGRGTLCERLDTISYFSELEPHWNEQPFFSLIETHRGRVGYHIDLTSEGFLDFARDGVPSLYGPRTKSPVASSQFIHCIRQNGNRVLLSGMGGDEMLGGVPTATPEIADLLARCKLRTLAHQLKMWALANRQPWFQILHEAVRSFLPVQFGGGEIPGRARVWLNRHFEHVHHPILTRAYRLQIFNSLPSFQINQFAVKFMSDQLSFSNIPTDFPCERRYPFLDRDLVEFCFAVPREQMVRPAQRRSLMRRALYGIVPDPILNRRRKAFVSYGPCATLRNRWEELLRMSEDMTSEKLGIIDARTFLNVAGEAYHKMDVHVTDILQACLLEYWLRGIAPRLCLATRQKLIGRSNDNKPIIVHSGTCKSSAS